MTTGTLPVHFDLAIEAGAWPDERVVLGWFEQAIGSVLRLVDIPLNQGEISIVLTDDDTMQAINREHRGKDAPTNVLSFPAMAPDALARLTGDRPFLLGDLVFAASTIDREARKANISFADHMAHLIVHGFLHLLGYDHEIDANANAMEALEIAALDRLKIANPYAS